MAYLGGWIIITVSYFITLFVSFSVGELLFPTNEQLGDNTFQVIEKNRIYLRYFIAAMMLIFPYIIAGFYSKKRLFNEPIKGALWLSIVPVIAERIIIFLLGLAFVPTFLSEWNIGSVIPFIQWETPAIYYSYFYIASGFISILITIGISKYKKIMFKRKTIY